MKKLLVISSIILCVWSANILAASNRINKIVWTAVFRNITSNDTKYTDDYCRKRTPVVMISTIKQITSQKGVTSSNGIKIRYVSHETKEKNGLYFTIINAVLSGIDEQGKPWSTPMKLYEHMLAPLGQAYAVWSTAHCKGTFIGTPTVVHY